MPFPAFSLHLLNMKRLTLLTGLWTFAVLAHAADPAKPATNEPLSPFGIGAGAASSRTIEAVQTWAPQVRDIGVTWYRTGGNAGWSRLQTPDGKWQWEDLDQHMAYWDGLGIKYGLLLWGNNSKDAGGLPVKGIDDWKTYVGNLAKHIKGRVQWLEVWNEPPNFTAKGQTAGDYGKLVAATSDAARAVDPGFKVGLTAKSSHINYLEHAIRRGAKGKYDWISLHPYEILGGVADNKGTEVLYMHIVPTVRKMLAAQDPAKKDVPILFTELGCDAGTPGSGHGKGPEGAADALIKAYTMGIAQGVTQIQWFEGRDGDSGPMGLLDARSNPRPAYTAYGNLIKHFGSHPKYLGWVMLNGRDYGFVFAGADGTVLSTWAPKGNPDRVDFGQPVKIIEPLTGVTTNSSTYDLTVSPIFVLGVPENLVAQAKANKDKPLPWGGDYANAKSVSLTYGEDGKAIAKGLHPTSGEDIGRDVVLYGGGSREGSVPGGDAFIVDPNFLSYKTGPIEISTTVRRKNTDKPASVTLRYEYDNPQDPVGTDPFKQLPPQEIPAGDKGTTLKWKLNDAEFNSYWGYNFSFNKGDYLVQNVTVKKLR
jgi:hypothetical protein